MSDKKISELAIIPEIVDEDYIQIIDADEIDPSSRNKRVLIPLLREYLTMPVDTVKLQSIAQGDWIAGGTSGFYFDITHTLETKNLFRSVYDITGGKYDGYELAQYLPQSDTVYRVESSINTVDVIVLLSTGGSSVVVNGGGGGVASVSGSMVDNTDPLNPVINSDDTKSNKATAQTLANTASITLTSNSADRSINIYAGQLVTVTIGTAAVLEVGEGFEVNVGDAFGFVFDVGSENLFGIITGSTTVGDSVFIRRLPDDSFGLTGRVYKVS